MDFASLDLPSPSCRGFARWVRDRHADQEAALPLALRGKDVAGQSQTGTGKTGRVPHRGVHQDAPHTGAAAASGVGAPRMLVIAPTRELVVQIESDARQLGRFTPFRTLAVYAASTTPSSARPSRRAAISSRHAGPADRLPQAARLDTGGAWRSSSSTSRPDVRHGFIADLRFILRRLPTPDKRSRTSSPRRSRSGVLELTWSS